MRIIATVLCLGERVIQTYAYGSWRIVGSPAITVKHLDMWNVDEVVVLQVDGCLASLQNNLRSISSSCSTPVTAGGGIKNAADAGQVLLNGADRICIQSMAFTKPQDAIECAKQYGGQAITVKIDFSLEKHILGRNAYRLDTKSLEIMSSVLETLQEHDIVDLFINSIDADGLVKEPDFDFVIEGLSTSRNSLVLGGGIGASNAQSIYTRYKSSAQSLSLSISNTLYQKELASQYIIEGISELMGVHRLR